MSCAVNGGGNSDVAPGAFSVAGQDTTTIGGTALGRSRVITNGGHNDNFARGFGSNATQSTLTVGGSAFGHGRPVTNGGDCGQDPRCNEIRLHKTCPDFCANSVAAASAVATPPDSTLTRISASPSGCRHETLSNCQRRQQGAAELR
jgi:hypothetical protein